MIDSQKIESKLRLFAAIDLPRHLKERIGLCVQMLKKCDADVRWTPMENLHLTLKFFGGVPPGRFAEIEAGLREAAMRTKPFTIALDGSFDAFPNSQASKIVWIGVREGKPALSELARQVENEAQALGFEREDRPFTAHLTVGRVRSAKNNESLREAVRSVRLDMDAPFEVNSFSIYESRTLPAGAVYRPLGSYPFLT